MILSIQLKQLHRLLEHYFPCPYNRGSAVLVSTGILSTLLYVYTKIWYRGEFQSLPENLMILTFFISAWGLRAKLNSDLIFRLLLLSILIPIFLFGINSLLDFETAYKYRSLKDLLHFFFFLPLAWWVGGSLIGAMRVLAIAFFGLITAILLDPNLLQSINNLWLGNRVDFNMHNAQHGALFFGIVVLFCLSCFSMLKQKIISIWTKVLLFLACIIGLVGVLGTQTRAAILGLVVCSFLALIHQSFYLLKRSSFDRGFVVVALVLGVVMWVGTDIIENRFAKEKATIETLLAGNLEQLPFTSIGIRVHSWAESLTWIAERPVTGWGRKARSDVIQKSDRFPDRLKAKFGHLHNGYLELLLGFGIVGLVFLIVLWATLLKRIQNSADKTMFNFALYGSVYFLFMNLFESFLFYWSGIFAMSLLMGTSYSQYLAKTLTDER